MGLALLYILVMCRTKMLLFSQIYQMNQPRVPVISDAEMTEEPSTSTASVAGEEVRTKIVFLHII